MQHLCNKLSVYSFIEVSIFAWHHIIHFWHLELHTAAASCHGKLRNTHHISFAGPFSSSAYSLVWVCMRLQGSCSVNMIACKKHHFTTSFGSYRIYNFLSIYWTTPTYYHRIKIEVDDMYMLCMMNYICKLYYTGMQLVGWCNQFQNRLS